MTRIHRLMKLHRLMDEANDGTTGSTGGGAIDKPAGEVQPPADGNADDEAAAAAAAAAAKPKPTDAEAKLLREVMQAKEKAEKTNKELAEANRRLKDFEGIEPEKVRALLKAQADAETAQLEARGDYERLKKQMVEAHTAEKSVLSQQIEMANATNASLQQQIANLTVGQAFAASDFVLNDLTLTVNKARVIYGSQFEFVEGRVVGFDKPAGAADRTMLVDGSGEPLKFDEALRKIVDADPDKPQLLKAKSKPGSGSASTSRVARTNAEVQKPQRNSVEKIAQGLRTLAKQ